MTGSSPQRCFWLNRVIDQSVRRHTSVSVRYCSAAAFALFGILCANYLRTYLGHAGVSLTLLITVVVAIFGGLGPGVLAAMISAISVDFYLSDSYDFGLPGIWRVFVFVTISCLVSFLVSGLRISLVRAEQAREDAEKANQEKDAVIAFLSHDLRGPLSSISLIFQLIKKYADTEGKEQEVRRLANNGVFSCHRMAHLIQNLLDASKIKAGGIVLSSKVQDLRALVSSIFEEHRLLAEEKQIQFHLRCESTAAQLVACDPMLLSQVVANLILNAFKFTPTGGEVTVCLREEAEQFCVEVSDNGEGIPENQLKNIFDKFWQAKSRLGEGAGLGLYISRAIVVAHRGELSVESGWRQGSRFIIRLPKSTASSTEVSVSLVRDLESA